jgi:hypothetical protein
MRESVCGTSRHVAALRISVAFGAKRTLSYASLAVLQRRTLHHEHHTNKNKNPPLGSSHAVTIAVTDDPMMLCSKPVLQRAAPDATLIRLPGYRGNCAGPAAAPRISKLAARQRWRTSSRETPVQLATNFIVLFSFFLPRDRC